MASRPVSILELVSLREYAPLDSLFRLLPKKAQRVLALSQSNIDVELTCVDASSEFIVLGSNISIVYVFDRQEQQLAKLRCEVRKLSLPGGDGDFLLKLNGKEAYNSFERG